MIQPQEKSGSYPCNICTMKLIFSEENAVNSGPSDRNPGD